MTEILNSTKIIQLELDLRPLRARLEGDVVGPGDADWDEARLAWNLAVDQRPAAVAVPDPPRTSRPSSRSHAPKVFALLRRAPATTPERSATSRTRSCSRPTGCAASRSTRTPAPPAPRPA